LPYINFNFIIIIIIISNIIVNVTAVILEVFSVPVTTLLKIFIPQLDPKSVINTFEFHPSMDSLLTFNLLLITFRYSVYY